MADNKEYIVFPDSKGNINVSEEVIAVIAGSAAIEVDGVAGLSTYTGKDIIEIRGKRSLARGVQITVEEDAVSANVYIITEMGFAVNEVGKAVQVAVIAAIEGTTGFSVAAVNVHVCGISLKKNK